MKIDLTPANMAILECFSSETRVRILNIIAGRPCNIKDLAAELGVSPAIITRHVVMMENAGIIRSDFSPSIRGRQKVCSLAEEEITIVLRPAIHRQEAQRETFRLGQYRSAKVGFPCGLMSGKGVIGVKDDARYFQAPDRNDVHELWFADGGLEYWMPLQIPLARATALRLQFRAKAEGYRGEAAESSLLVRINGTLTAEISLPAAPELQEFDLLLTEQGAFRGETQVSVSSIRQIAQEKDAGLSIEIGMEKKRWPDSVLRLKELDGGEGIIVTLFE